MLILSRRTDESIIIDGRIVVEIIDIKGDQVKLGIKAPRDIKVHRSEVYQAIQNQNLKSIAQSTELPHLALPGRKNSEQE